MAPSLPLTSRSNGSYFDRVPERLVLEGYRYWSAGYETGSIQPWEMAWKLYTTALGPADGRRALSELSHFIRTLKGCASCPLRSFPYNSQHMCMEECLNIALIAGLQHKDDVAALCLERLACPATCTRVEEAARSFAETLSEIQQVLLPVPKHVIEDVLLRASGQTYH